MKEPLLGSPPAIGHAPLHSKREMTDQDSTAAQEEERCCTSLAGLREAHTGLLRGRCRHGERVGVLPAPQRRERHRARHAAARVAAGEPAGGAGAAAAAQAQLAAAAGAQRVHRRQQRQNDMSSACREGLGLRGRAAAAVQAQLAAAAGAQYVHRRQQRQTDMNCACPCVHGLQGVLFEKRAGVVCQRASFCAKHFVLDRFWRWPCHESVPACTKLVFLRVHVYPSSVWI